jgi:hypothetical protein
MREHEGDGSRPLGTGFDQRLLFGEALHGWKSIHRCECRCLAIPNASSWVLECEAPRKTYVSFFVLVFLAVRLYPYLVGYNSISYIRLDVIFV